jgi:hypothetical protein
MSLATCGFCWYPGLHAIVLRPMKVSPSAVWTPHCAATDTSEPEQSSRSEERKPP